MDSKMRGIVRVEPYNPAWKAEFEQIKIMLFTALGELAIAVEHVGSTSVAGLAAKPILDIDVVIDSYKTFPQVLRQLSTLGFVHEGDGGIPGREVFKRSFEDSFMPYHLYVCPKDSLELKRHLAFRKYLAVHPEDREIYGNLKLELAERFRTDIKGYMEGKHDCVQEILRKIEEEGFEPHSPGN